jgi:arabinose-5-phosphate isomerase
MNNPNITATRVIVEESRALIKLSDNLPRDFSALVDYIIGLKGKVILTGIGKSGYIARKIAASFSSTGTASFYLHPAEASHGDLGMVGQNDLVIMLSNSGETKELFDIIDYCKRFTIKLVAITMGSNSTIAKNSDFLLLIPTIQEASLIAAPTTSALMMLSIGDALTIAVQEAKGFSAEDFRIYHPGGKIGANLLKVKDLMRVEDKIPIVRIDSSFADTVIIMTQKTLGCAIVTDVNNKLIGIITDGDLRRHINNFHSLKYACDIMTTNPQYILESQLAQEALFIMNSNAINVLPVIDNNIVIGVIHIHDLLRCGVG